MKKNVGSVDRWIRILLGIALLSLLFTDLSFKYVGLIGIVPILTALIKSCPLYSLFGFTTCPMKNNK